MCGWSERGVEDGWRVERNAFVSWAWHLRVGAYHARYPRLTFSLEAADRSFIWTSVHQMEGDRKEERKGGRKEGRKESAGSETCECKRTERSRSRHRHSLFLHVTPTFAAGPALSIRASILLFLWNHYATIDGRSRSSTSTVSATATQTTEHSYPTASISPPSSRTPPTGQPARWRHTMPSKEKRQQPVVNGTAGQTGLQSTMGRARE